MTGLRKKLFEWLQGRFTAREIYFKPDFLEKNVLALSFFFSLSLSLSPASCPGMEAGKSGEELRPQNHGARDTKEKITKSV